jgi:hypothetical protein
MGPERRKAHRASFSAESRREAVEFWGELGSGGGERIE